MTMPINVADGFYIPAKNSRGKDHNIGFRCWPEFARMVSRIISKRMFNYRTAADLLRHALWRHIQWLASKDERLKEDVNWMEAFMEVVRSSEKRREYGTMIAYMDKEVDALKRAGALEDAKNLAFELLSLVAKSESGDTWRRKAVKHIRLKHADLLAMGFTPNGQ